MKAGDLVRLSGEYKNYETPMMRGWRGIVLRQASLIDSLDEEEQGEEWVIHWLHHPVGEECFEYEYYLEVISESH